MFRVQKQNQIIVIIRKDNQLEFTNHHHHHNLITYKLYLVGTINLTNIF